MFKLVKTCKCVRRLSVDTCLVPERLHTDRARHLIDFLARDHIKSDGSNLSAHAHQFHEVGYRV